MNVTREETGTGKLKLTISVPPEEYEKHLQKTAKRLGEKITIAGFRKGHVPYEIIKRHIGEMELLSSALDDIVASTLEEAWKSEGGHIALQPKVQVTKAAPGNTLEYSVEVVITPKVFALPEFGTLVIAKNPIEITESKIDELIETVRKMRAQETVKEGVVENSNKVEFDITFALLPGKELKEELKNQTVTVGERAILPEMERHFIGLKSGEEKTFFHSFAKDYFKEEYAGKDAEVTVKVKKIWEIQKPELTDEFARSLNKEFTDVALFKQKMRENLTVEEEQKEAKRRESEMIDLLIAKAAFSPIAFELIARTVKQMVEEIKGSVSRQGVLWDDYLSRIKKDEQALEKEIAPVAEHRIKHEALIAHVAEEQKFRVSEEEVERGANVFLSQFSSLKEAQKTVDPKKLTVAIYASLLERKVVVFLKNKILK